AKQDYHGELEIIIVNDRSEDKTGEISENFIKEHPNFKLVNITETDEELTGKQYAMQTGIEQSTGDIIISTDADCEVSYGWVSSMASYFNDDIGLVAGYSAPPLGGVFSALQAMDHLFLVGIASGFSGTGLPQSCIGNNIAFRRSVYDDIGGYQGIGRTVTEDVGLLKGIANNTSYKVIFNREIESLVKTRPAFSLTELTSQRMRWL
ncbi:MAG: glycosyltransferase, partial [FCB group bacterium]|nr:glycosyltransferase [FCB group bacterium]